MSYESCSRCFVIRFYIEFLYKILRCLYYFRKVRILKKTVVHINYSVRAFREKTEITVGRDRVLYFVAITRNRWRRFDVFDGAAIIGTVFFKGVDNTVFLIAKFGFIVYILICAAAAFRKRRTGISYNNGSSRYTTSGDTLRLYLPDGRELFRRSFDELFTERCDQLLYWPDDEPLYTADNLLFYRTDSLLISFSWAEVSRGKHRYVALNVDKFYTK